MFIAGIVLVLIAIALIAWLVFYSYNPSSKVLDDQIVNVHDCYDPNIKTAEARRQANKAAERAGLAVTLTHEVAAAAGLEKTRATAVFQNDNVLPKLKREEELSLTQHQFDIDSLNLQRNLVNFAQRSGMDVATYLEILKTRELNELELQKIEAQGNIDMVGGFMVQLQAYQRLAMLRDNLDGLYEREHQIESGNDAPAVKKKKLIMIKEDIELHEEDVRGRRQRLLQGLDGEKEVGDEEEPYSSGNP